MKEIKFYKNLFEKNFNKNTLLIKKNKNLSKTSIKEAALYILNQKSKRIRPVLMLLFCHLYNGNINQCVYASISVELLHNFTLIHDDIMDKSKIRRSQKTVHEKWDQNIAILTGDFLFNESFKSLHKIDDSRRFKKIIKILNKSLFDLCLGQDQDLSFEKIKKVSMSDYLSMIYNKTTSLIQSSILIGSYIGGIDKNDIKIIENIGCKMGAIFQLRDDYLDIYGSKENFGKKLYNDIINNKKTFFYVKTQEIASKKDKERLRYLYSHNNINSKKKIKEVLSIYDNLNLKNNLNKKLEMQYQIIQQKILDLKVKNNSVKNIILNYVKFLTGRDV